MKSVFKTNIVLLVIAMPLFSLAQNIDSNYEVATWQGFTEAAITYTFDDNCSNQYAIAIPALDQAGFCGTFYPVMNWGPQWAKFKAAAANGHEIGSHTVTHPTLSNLDLNQQEGELKNSKEKVDAEVGEGECETIAYPYCVPSDVSLTKEYYIAARHCQGQINKSTPSDFYNISSIICGEAGSLKSVDNFKTNAENTAKIQGWSVFLIHGIDGNGGYSSLNSDVLKESLEYFNQNRGRFWVITFVNAVKYIRERNCVSVKEKEATNQQITVEIKDTLNNSIYSEALSFRRILPDGWSSAFVIQAGDTLNSKLVSISGQKFVEFNAAPDLANVQIVKVDNASSSLQPQRSLIKLEPNPFMHELRISTSGSFAYQIFSLKGQIIESGTCYQSELIGQKLDSGTYLLNITSENKLINRKIVKM